MPRSHRRPSSHDALASFRTAGLLLLGACLSLPLSAKESAEGFSRQVALSLQGEGPWYRLSIPMSVQLSAAHADLRDLRVFDAEGEALPYALVAGSERQASTPHEAEVRLFPLRGARPPPTRRSRTCGCSATPAAP
ncbi:DUF3999 family protein [Pseudomonas aeruginosa]|nr:DUF3999 family protein [Pseudomonas aeruginosa]